MIEIPDENLPLMNINKFQIVLYLVIKAMLNITQVIFPIGEVVMFRKQRQITFRIPICIEEDGDAYHAHCPVLPGVHIDGETREEALENVKTAIELYINSLIKHQEPIPLQIVHSKETHEVCSSNPNIGSPCSHSQAENILVTV